MNLDSQNYNLLLEIFQSLNSQDPENVRQIMESIYNEVMKIEREHHLEASPYERSDKRRDWANGFKNKSFHTLMDKLNLKIPQTRESSFYPSSIEKGSRSERALKTAIAEMYIQGVSTRKVASITKELCGLDVSSTQVSAMAKELDEEFEIFRNRPLGQFSIVYFDATYLKVRHLGSVRSIAVLIAYGVNSEGKREIIGISTGLSEAEVLWRDFFESLQKRGLSGIHLIVSDSHSGLRKALKSVFPSVPWQRCQFHFAQNAQSYVPKKSMNEELSKALKRVLQSADKSSAEIAKCDLISRYAESAPEFVNWFESNIDEALTCLNFPVSDLRRIRTTNGLERVNREIKRRTRVATLFPNKESALRLVTGVLIEIHEDWLTGKTYLDVSELEGI